MPTEKNIDKNPDESGFVFGNFFKKNNAIMLLIAGDTGQLMDANDAALHFYGYSLPELKKLKIGDINKLPPEELSAERELALQEERNNFTVPHQLANGEIRTVEVNTTPIALAGRKYLFSIINDITKRRQAEEALRESEEKYRNLFENANEGIFVAQDGKLVFLNPLTKSWLGYSEDEIISESFVDFIYPDDRDLVIDRHVRRMKGEDVPERYPFRIIRKDGNIRWVEISAIKINWQGKPATLNFLVDITNRMQAEEGIKENEEKFRLAFMTGLDAYYWATLEDGKIIEVNPVFENLFGYRRDEVIGKTSTELNLYNDSADRAKIVSELKTKGFIKDLELKGRRKDEKIIIISFSASKMIIKNRMFILGVMRDITERKEAKDAVQLNEERLKKLVDILQHPADTIQEFLDYALEQAIQLTGSKIGYIYHYDEDRKEFILNTWSKDVMAECSIANPQTCYALDKTGIWGEAVRQGQPIIVNDFSAAHPLKKGYPAGHAQLLKYMTVPVFRGGKIVGVVGLGNKETDYKENNVLQVSLLMEAVWKVTDRMRAEEELKRSEEKFRNYIESAPDAVLITDETGRYIEVNDSGCRIFGYTKGEIANISIRDLLAEESAADGIAHFNKVVKTGKAVADLWHKHKDGSKRCLTVSAVKLSETRILGFAKDITERKQAEYERQISEERFRKIFDESPIGIAFLNEKREIFLTNQHYRNFLGYSEEEIIERQGIGLLHPDDWAASVALSTKLRNSEIPLFHMEQRYIRKDGAVVSSDTRITALRDKTGQLIHTIGWVEDITARKQAEEKMREMTERLQLATVSAKAGVWDWNLQTNEMIWDDRMYELYGLTRENFPGGVEAWKMGLQPDDSARTIAECEAALRGEREFNTEFRVRRPDGSEIYVKANGLVHRDEKGNPLRMIGLNTDITERKQSEHALRDSKAQLDIALLSASLGTWYLDLIDKKRHFDNQVCHILGIDQATFGGTEEEFFRVVHPDDVGIIKAALSRTIEESAIYKVEYRVIWKDASVHYINARGMLVRDQKGQAVRINGVIWDITEHKQAEEEKRILEERLQRAEKMEALGLLAGGVAHDLNNVLGIVVGYAEMIMNDLDETNPIREDLISIMEGGQRASAIVQDLLTLARRGVAGRKVVNLNRLILDYQKTPEVEKLFSHHASVKVKTDLEADLLNISASSVHLGKTLFNLLSNAAEAMPKGGTLTIKTANKYLDKPLSGYDEIREGDYVLLSVADTGEGIGESDLKRIFEPFYTKKVMGRSGTGLGLSVVWGTVKDHQGYINVHSEEGKGTSFILYFPVTREEMKAEASSALSKSEYMGKDESILVVDDVKGQRDLATAMLKKLGYNVRNVASGEEAVEYLKKNKVDLLVLDMIMDPGMDGLDTYKSILAIHPKQKAIIVSGFSETARVDAAYYLGAGAYVKKPYVIEKLGMAVKKELAGK